MAVSRRLKSCLSVLLVCVLLICVGTLGAAGLGSAQQPLPVLDAAQGRNATVLPVPGGIKITFRPAEWPNVFWSAGADRAWDWHGASLLAFDFSNPGSRTLTVSVRMDDDAQADGVSHSRTAWATLGAGQSGTFFVDLVGDDPLRTEGMQAGPPFPGSGGMRVMTGMGAITLRHIVGFQIFLHRLVAPCALIVSRPRLIPALTRNRRYSQIVDAYGQFTRGNWPGKVHSLGDFSARRGAEARETARTSLLPGRDPYGGWADGPRLPGTGFFTTTQRDGRWWLVTPNGHLFLSLGVNEVSFAETTRVSARQELFSWLPTPGTPLAESYGEGAKTFDFYSANLQRKYGPGYPGDWRLNAVARLKRWGFNTIGNWSSEKLEALHRFPYTATLSVEGAGSRLPASTGGSRSLRDPFDARFPSDCAESFRAKALELRDDPWCLGYFVDNELPWNGSGDRNEPDGLALQALAAPGGQPAKRAFQRQLEAKYGAVERFDAAWGISLKSWADFDALFEPGAAPSPRQQLNRHADETEFVYRFALRYFTVVRDTLHRFDSHHLYLGCRFAGRSADAERAAAAVCDVVSYNVYAPGLDPATWASTENFNKPCLVSEFQFGALDRGMFAAGLVPAPGQAQRAGMMGDYVDSVLDRPTFVGVHWYKYADEPLTGRSLDGENSNIGFVSVTDTPYPEMVAAARRVLANAYARHANSK